VFVTQWGSLGDADGQFNSAVGVALDEKGNVFVVGAEADWTPVSTRCSGRPHLPATGRGPRASL